MEITISELENHILIIKISGRLDATNALDFRALFEEKSLSHTKFIFDLSKLDFIDSTGLGGLVYCLKITDEKKGIIKIANLQPKPKLVFDTTRAETIFKVYDTIESAVLSFNKYE